MLVSRPSCAGQAAAHDDMEVAPWDVAPLNWVEFPSRVSVSAADRSSLCLHASLCLITTCLVACIVGY